MASTDDKVKVGHVSMHLQPCRSSYEPMSEFPDVLFNTEYRIEYLIWGVLESALCGARCHGPFPRPRYNAECSSAPDKQSLPVPVLTHMLQWVWGTHRARQRDLLNSTCQHARCSCIRWAVNVYLRCCRHFCVTNKSNRHEGRRKTCWLEEDLQQDTRSKEVVQKLATCRVWQSDRNALG